MSLTYATDLFDESTVASFAERVRDESSPQLVQRIRTVRGWQISTYLAASDRAANVFESGSTEPQ